MNTSASNRRLRLLLTAIRDQTLIPRPEFQRRLVWTNTHKIAFIDTVLNGYPFPEIYIAAGDVNPETGDGTEVLVDGQQRITTLYQYFVGSDDLKLTRDLPSYIQLSDNEKLEFLEYQVVIRDLGNKTLPEIIEIFTRINSTNYALNAMEIQNARFEGEFKKFGEGISQDEFFENNYVFRASEIRRMQDVQFALIFIITIMSTYFNRINELDNYLRQYNDEFENSEPLSDEIDSVFQFINSLEFDKKCRVWQKADLLTILVETHRLLFKEGVQLENNEVGERLKHFYSRVDLVTVGEEINKNIIAYHTATAQANNDRGNRVLRGEILRSVILGEFDYGN